MCKCIIDIFVRFKKMVKNYNSDQCIFLQIFEETLCDDVETTIKCERDTLPAQSVKSITLLQTFYSFIHYF